VQEVRQDFMRKSNELGRIVSLGGLRPEKEGERQDVELGNEFWRK
jgi:hypothetical protein